MTDDNMPPLPEGREYIAGTNRHFMKVCGTVTAYSADDMRAYAAKARREAMEECARMLDAEHERSKHMHNYAACYARAIRADMP
jgi:nicotinamide riboside kinase